MGCGRRECRGGEGCGWQRIRRQRTERQRKWQCVLFCTLFHILICILFHVPFYILLGHTFYFLLSISFSTLFSVLILRKLIRSNCLGISNQAVCYSFVFSISFSILFSVLFSIRFSIASAPADCCVPLPLTHPSRFPGPARSPPRPAANAAHSAHPDRATPPWSYHPIRRSPRLLRGRPALPTDVRARPSLSRAPSPGGQPPRACTSSGPTMGTPLQTDDKRTAARRRSVIFRGRPALRRRRATDQSGAPQSGWP